MSPTTKSTLKGTGDDVDLDEAKFLWDEYRYRHDLCWRLIFQITTAVVAILIVPYIQPTITKSVGLWVVALPSLAFTLVLFSMSRMMRELEILGKVRTAHRARQSKIHHMTWTNGSHFARDVMLYLLGLMIVCIAAGFSLIYIWRPA